MPLPGTNPSPANVQLLHMNDELLPAAELAGDLLDGDVDGQVRATGADDASVVTLAEQFRSVRSALADVPAAPAQQRDAAISAALAVYDQAASAPAASAVPAPATVVPLVRRNTRRWYQVASIAAAVAAIGVIGTIAIDRMGGSDLDTADSAETSPKDVFGAERSAENDTSAAGGDTLVAADSTSAAAQTPTPESAPVPTISSIGGPADFLVPVNSPAELLSLAQQPSNSDGVEPSLITSDCPTDGAVVLAAVRYQGVAALVWVDSSTGNVQAVDATTCEVLETVTP